MKIIAIVAICLAAAFVSAVAVLRFLYPVKYRDEVRAACEEFGVEESLVLGVIRTESRFKPNACSSAGAVGLMQLMPNTAMWIADTVGEPQSVANLYDPAVNIRLGTAYLSYLLGKYPLADALAAYNAGEGNLRAWQAEGREEYAFKETRDYVKRVLRARKIYAGL